MRKPHLQIDDATRLMDPDEVCLATRMDLDTLANLVFASLFPAPVHQNPPLWAAPEVETWVIAAAKVAARAPEVKSWVETQNDSQTAA